MKRSSSPWLSLALALGRRRSRAYQAVAAAQLQRAADARRHGAARRPDLNAIEAYSGAIALRPARCSPTCAAARRTSGAAIAAISRPPHATSAPPPRSTRPRPIRSRRSATRCSSRSSTPAPRSAYERYARLDDRSARVTYKLALSRYRDREITGAIAALKTRCGSTIITPTRSICSASASGSRDTRQTR